MLNRKGFTLVEMVVVLAIIGILLSVTYPSLVSTMKTSRENDRVRHEYVVNKALKQYYALTGKYPNQGHDSDTSSINSTELKALQDALLSETGVTLDATKYTYTYAGINGDEEPPYNISSLHIYFK